MKGMNRRKNSGQVLIITSLIVVLLLISTVVYVTEIEKNAPTYIPDADMNFSALKQAALHTAISALANITNGGNQDVLSADLASFENAVENNIYYGTVSLGYSPLTSAPYVNGVWLSWGTNGTGNSSIVVDFALNDSSFSSSYCSEYTVNVTSSISIFGYFTQLNSSQKQVNLYCSLLNEGISASAGNFAIYYELDNSTWVPSASFVTTNYGNGTYAFSFVSENTSLNSLPISVQCQDTRGISIWANATCTALT